MTDLYIECYHNNNREVLEVGEYSTFITQGQVTDIYILTNPTHKPLDKDLKCFGAFSTEINKNKRSFLT